MKLRRAESIFFGSLVLTLPITSLVWNLCENNGLITKIDSSTSLAFLKLDIYLEGWDLDFTDRELNHLFKLNLEFDFNEEG